MAGDSHVVFFIHGVDGRPREFNLMTRAFVEKLPSVTLHVCNSFCGITHRGGAAAARAVADELRTVIERTRCDRLSVVCHSYGGVVMAYALHLLGERLNSVKLINYVALATPFVGIRGSATGAAGLKLLPSSAKRSIERQSTTIMELCLEDTHMEGTPASSSTPALPPSPEPFLRRVARPDVLNVLGRFERRARADRVRVYVRSLRLSGGYALQYPFIGSLCELFRHDCLKAYRKSALGIPMAQNGRSEAPCGQDRCTGDSTHRLRPNIDALPPKLARKRPRRGPRGPPPTIRRSR